MEKENKNEFRRLGNTNSLGNTNRLGNTDSLGNLTIRNISGRRAFFDDVKDFIKQNPDISLTKLEAYYQYTTGASSTSIKQALAVLENIGLIESYEDENLELHFK